MSPIYLLIKVSLKIIILSNTWVWWHTLVTSVLRLKHEYHWELKGSTGLYQDGIQKWVTQQSLYTDSCNHLSKLVNTSVNYAAR